MNMVGGRSRSWWLVAEVLAMFVVVDQMGRRGGISARNFDCACHENTKAINLYYDGARTATTFHNNAKQMKLCIPLCDRLTGLPSAVLNLHQTAIALLFCLYPGQCLVPEESMTTGNVARSRESRDRDTILGKRTKMLNLTNVVSSIRFASSSA